ncbi:hypothetical protein CFBP498_26230 [Xanthomonas hortorum pv. vitians]|uniref:Uncharacterized protein n=1 Tax=Xanthomonas hortorum pv. vitians TaxID=83224 RepID=A0A6V7DQQ3_9XANT|nr:hypothetical protein CFBP498_26230 [Xanthomonas hortorum pv. vitians]CAD0338859.1 hypothetical protein CFBP498_26230 [Xanthomonas hortorum pv. vitians]
MRERPILFNGAMVPTCALIAAQLDLIDQQAKPEVR